MSSGNSARKAPQYPSTRKWYSRLGCDSKRLETGVFPPIAKGIVKGATRTRRSEAGEFTGVDQQGQHNANKKDWMALPTHVPSLRHRSRNFPRVHTRKLRREPAACEGGTPVAFFRNHATQPMHLNHEKIQAALSDTTLPLLRTGKSALLPGGSS